MDETGIGPLSPRRLRRLLKEYARALREDPGNLVLRLKLAFVLRELGRSAEAIDMYRNVAVAYAQSGRMVQAMAVCKGILEIDPAHSETQALLAELAQEQGARQQTGTIRIQEVDGRWVAVPAPLADPDLSREYVDDSEDTSDDALDEVRGHVDGVAGRAFDSFAPTPAPGEPEALPPPPGTDAALVPTFDPERVPPDVFGPDRAAAPHGVLESEIGTRPGGWVPLGMMPAHDDSLPSGAIRSQVVNEAQTVLARPAIRLSESDLLEVDDAPPDDELDPFSLEESKVLAALGTPMPQRDSGNVVPVPLLSALPRDAFVQFIQTVPVRHAPAGTMVLCEGEHGDAFYIIIGGHVRVLKNQRSGPPVEVARLGPGAFFGEFALLSDSLRHASIEAIDEVELFEVSKALLDGLVARFPDVGRTVWRFYRERLIETLIATAPFFVPLTPEERAVIAGRLRGRRYAAKAEIVVEGGRRGGLYLILLGEVEVTRKRPDGTSVVVAQLQEGSYFGEMSLLRGGAPPVATVTATRDCEIVELPPASFYELVARHPELWDAVKREADRRESAADALLSGETRQSKPEIYLV
ncbi:MAG: cyclic nucleotide-binding domain-containing protein [Deltaproteobacteria bacterium]|nr:cyclic nucleotide-binding domain-containing protein [Deltaproteobacteria bacterium]